MIIKELNLTAFGKFKNEKILLEDGINLVYGGNETGKSTLHKFIEGMLFGFFKDSWSRRLYNEDYDKYMPVEGNDYRGSMLLEAEGKSIRIERNFLKGKDELKVYDEATGEDITGFFHYEPATKMYYLLDPGILNRNLYKNTVSIAQLKAKTDEDLAEELKERILNYSQSGTDISVNKAIKKLEKKLEQNGTERRKGSHLNLIVEKIEALQNEFDKAEKIQKRIMELTDQKKALVLEEEQQKNELDNLINRLENLEVKNIYQKFNNYKKLREEQDSLELDLESHTNQFVSEEDLREILLNHQEMNRLREDIEGSYEYLAKIESEIARLKDEFNLHDENLISESYLEDRDRLFELKEEKIHISQDIKKRGVKRHKNNAVGLAFSGICAGLCFYAGSLYSNIYMMGAGAFFASVAMYFLFKLLMLRGKGIAGSELENLKSRIIEIDVSVEDILSRYDAVSLNDLKEKWEQIKSKRLRYSEEIDRIKILTDRLAYVGENIKNFEETYIDRQKMHSDKLEIYQVESLEELLASYEKQKNIRKKALRLEEVIRTMDMLMDKEEYKKLEDFFRGKGLPESYKEDPESLKLQIAKLKDKIGQTTTLKDKAEGEILALEKDVRLPQIIKEDIEYMEELKARNTSKSQSIALAINKINEASKQMHSEIAPELNKNLGELMEKITKRYKSFKVSKDINISVEDPVSGMLMEARHLSMGTVDQLYFSLRIGMAKILGIDGFPLILDESFLQYDDERLKRALEILVEESVNRQIILFTSQNREGDVLRKTKSISNIINLNDLEGSAC